MKVKSMHFKRKCLTVGYLRSYTLLLLLLFEYKRVYNVCVANVQSGYSDLFLSRFSENWFLFSLYCLHQEKFIAHVVILMLLPFYKEETETVSVAHQRETISSENLKNI